MILLLAASASAQKPEGQFRDVEFCNAASSPDRRIEACSAFIAAGRGGPQALAIAHNNRGIAYAAKADYGRANADFDVAIGIDPTFAKPVKTANDHANTNSTTSVGRRLSSARGC